MGILRLENENIRLEFDDTNGSLVGLTAVKTGWRILDRQSLGMSFLILLPLHDRRGNRIYGEKQKLGSVHMKDGKNGAVFTWDVLESEHGGIHPIKAVMDVSLESGQAVFTMTIDNKSEYIVENVYCPCIGDVSHPEDDKPFNFLFHFYNNFYELPVWPNYQENSGYHGVHYPAQMSFTHHTAGSPMTPFVLMQGDRQGLYMGSLSKGYDTVIWMNELVPGHGSSMDSMVPTSDEIGGRDVSLRFEAVHMPFILPGETRTLAPVALEAYEGGWQSGADIYKEWRSGWMKTAEIPSWAKDPHSWQQIQINTPENELWFQYDELVEIGRECARNGVKTIQLTGWNIGGQDGNNPSHDPDPLLGGFDALKDAIAEVRKMGVKVVIFTKFIWADRSTERFRNELIRYAIKDMYGDYEVFSGYSYQSVSQRLGISVKRLVPMCFLSEEYLKICVEEFKKVMQLGADGILFDECSWHCPALFCFDTEHGHRYGAMEYANDNRLIDDFIDALGDKAKDFIFAGEACYDMMFQKYHMSYIRTRNASHIPVTRYLQPDMLIMTAVIGFNDRNMINQCLMYRYVISYEPFNFKGRLGDYPLTVDYGRKMDELRTELREYLWDGEYRDTCGVDVLTTDGGRHKPYSVFTSRETGKACVVICNYDKSKSVTVGLKPHNGRYFTKYRLVDDPQWKAVSEGVSIPPYSAAVAIE